jgi:hypothetical protein
MNAVKIAGIVLLAAGLLGLLYGSFSFTKETHQAKLGPIELSVKEKQTVNVPVWAGLGAIVIGGVLLVLAAGRADDRFTGTQCLQSVDKCRRIELQEYRP